MHKRLFWGLCGTFLLLLALILLPVHRDGPKPELWQPPAPPENPYSPEDFYTDGPFIRCKSAPDAKVGVDVSAHQEEIDWAAVKNAGVDFAMIRVGYRGYSEGGLFEDEYARQNLQGALDAGLPIGVYFFSQAISVAEAREEAQFVLDMVQDYPLTYPVVFDWEWMGVEARTDHMDSGTLTRMADAFCLAIEEAGHEAAIYFNQDMAQNMLSLRRLQHHDFWLAQYHDKMTFDYAVDIWQYTPEGSVPGISTDVDLNLCFTDYTH